MRFKHFELTVTTNNLHNWQENDDYYTLGYEVPVDDQQQRAIPFKQIWQLWHIDDENFYPEWERDWVTGEEEGPYSYQKGEQQ